MPTSPGVTLSANLQSILGGSALGGFLRITLCGFGPVLPCIPGTGMLADSAVPQIVGPQEESTPISQELFGNDVITPPNTFYEIAVLDEDKNVIQTGMYQFLNSAGAVDLSEQTQIVGPFGFQLPALAGQACSGAVPGNTYTAPGNIIALFYNGSYLPPGQSLPTRSYTAVGEVATLNFNTEALDRIDALCIL